MRTITILQIPVSLKNGKLAHMWWNPVKLYKKKAPIERERKRNKGQGSKFKQASQPKWVGSQGGKGTTKNRILHQSCEACQLKRGEVNPIKLKPRWTLPLRIADMVGREKAKTWNIRLTKRSPKYNNYHNVSNFRSLSINHVLKPEKHQTLSIYIITKLIIKNEFSTGWNSIPWVNRHPHWYHGKNQKIHLNYF
jgi:hypothetical protein